MPEYTFLNKKNKKEVKYEMKISELDQFKLDNPHLEQLITGFGGFIPGIGHKPDDGFRDILREIKKANPRGTVDTW